MDENVYHKLHKNTPIVPMLITNYCSQNCERKRAVEILGVGTELAKLGLVR